MCDLVLARECKRKGTRRNYGKTGLSLGKEKLKGENTVISFASLLALPTVQ